MEYLINARDGTRLVARSWEAEKPRGVLLVVHGLGEYGSKYVSFASQVNGLGYTVCALDMRGFGFSGGRRGHAPSMETLCSDLEKFLDVTRKYYQGPFFLLGHSMGGTIALNAVCGGRLNVRGLILSSPWIGKERFAGNKWRIIRVLGVVFPVLTVEFDIKKLETGKRTRPLTAYADNNLHQKVTAGLFRELERAAQQAENFSGKLDLPVLGIHGRKDQVTDPHKTAAFIKKQEGKFLSWPQGGHVLHRGETRKAFCREIVKWMDKYIGS